MTEFTVKQYAHSGLEVAQEAFKGGMQFFRAAGQLALLEAIELTDKLGDKLDERWARMMDLGDVDERSQL